MNPLAGQMNEKRNLAETSHMIYHAAYSPAGEFIATTGSDNNIIIWNTGSWIIHRTLVGLKKRPNQAVFGPAGKYLYSAGEDGLISTWDLVLVQVSGTASGHTGAIKALAITPDGTRLVSAGDDRVVRVWAVNDGSLKLLYELKGHKKTVTAADISPDGRTAVTGSADKGIIMWDLQTGGLIREVEAHRGVVRCLEFSPDGRILCSGGDDMLIRIWDPDNLTEVKTLEGHTGWVQTLAFTPSGNQLISGGHDATIRIWNVESGKQVAASGKLEQIVLSVDASPLKNEFISSCLLSESLRIWANETGRGSDETTHMQGERHREEVRRESPQYEFYEPTRTEFMDVETGQWISYRSDPGVLILYPGFEEGITQTDETSVLLVGLAESGEGVQNVLINQQRIELSDAGVFQAEVPLHAGENSIELVAVSKKGKMSKGEMVVNCTDPNAPATIQAPAQAGTRYHALIIGISEYLDPDISDLDFPIRDADSLYAVLVSDYTFREEDMTYLKNPSRAEIFIAMDELGRRVTGNDNLLIFYAGHGYWDEKTGIGSWLPRDATRSNTANWFRNSALRDYIGSIPSKHTLLIADACFSGSIFKTRAGFRQEDSGIQKLRELPSRKAMTSGALNEVPDRSVFIKYLIRELKQNQAGFLPSETLFSNFKTAVLNNSPNVPQYGTIQNAGDEGGDFVFIRK